MPDAYNLPMTLALHVVATVLLTTVMFWAVILPRFQSSLEKAVAATVGACRRYLPPGIEELMRPYLLRALSSVGGENPGSGANVDLATVNVIVVLVAISVAVATAIATRATWRFILNDIVVLLLTYVLVAAAELYFVFNVAFRYRPVKPSYVPNELLHRVEVTCFGEDP